MPTIGDLRMIRGVDDATFAVLQQFLTVAPEPRVNINTASPEVIAALVPQLSNDTSTVKQIVQARTVQPFLMVTDVGNLAGLGDAGQPLMKLITTRSAYFTITGIGVFANARRRIISTFRRNPNGTSMLASWQEG
jgi:type II secretory pathway component PulK